MSGSAILRVLCVALIGSVSHQVLAQQTVDAAAPAADEKQERFTVLEYRILGNTVLKASAIESAVMPHLGPGKSLEDVEQVRGALAKLYQDAGYGAVFVDIPEQTVDSGIVRLQVTEGRVDRVRITGAQYFANSELRRELPALERGKVLHLPSLQHDLALAGRQSADRAITPVLKAGRQPGTVDVELKVQDELPLHASVEVNDRHTADTTDLRAIATLRYDNLWNSLHSLAFQYQTAPEEPDEARVLSATYLAPIKSTGHLLAAFVVDTDSEFTTLGADFASLGVLGKGQVYGLRYFMPLPEDEGYFHSVTFGADYKDFEERIMQPDGTPADTPISYINWSAGYSGTWRTQHTSSGFDVGMNFGVRGLANSSEEFHFKRFSGTPNKGDPGYWYLTAGARHERPLFWRFRGFLGLAGQYSPHALINNEQFALGGAERGRGYTESAVLGDYGGYGSFELRLPIDFGRWLSTSPHEFYLLTFYDAGIVAIQYPLDQQQRETALSSWGAGLRLNAFGLQAALDWAYPLSSAGDTLHGDSRIHFRLLYGF